jgi:arsenate reductase-like glutaredoxin family protein
MAAAWFELYVKPTCSACRAAMAHLQSAAVDNATRSRVMVHVVSAPATHAPSGTHITSVPTMVETFISAQGGPERRVLAGPDAIRQALATQQPRGSL